MQQFWSYYITVSLGLIAFFGSGKRSPILAGFVSVGFIAFAIVNCDGMTDIAAQRQFLFSRLPAAEIVDRAVISVASTGWPGGQTDTARTALRRLSTGGVMRGFGLVSEPPNPADVRNFHIAVDLGVVAAIWFLTLRSKPDEREKLRIKHGIAAHVRAVCGRHTAAKTEKQVGSSLSSA